MLLLLIVCVYCHFIILWIRKLTRLLPNMTILHHHVSYEFIFLHCRLEGKVKEVLLISRSTLLGTLPVAAGNYALKWLQKRNNIRVLLGDEIVGAPFSTDNNSSNDNSDIHSQTLNYHTLSGTIIQGDLFIDCTGISMKIIPPVLDKLILGSVTADLNSVEVNSKINNVAAVGITPTSVNLDSLNEVTKTDEVSDNDHEKIEDEETFMWPYTENGLIAVDEHLMV